MIRLAQAPNLALATLWADMLRGTGLEVSVLRAYSGSIAGEIPPDQALPELWLHDDDRLADARTLLQQLRRPRRLRWTCRRCGERIDGPFDTCWSCGDPAPPEVGLP